MVAFSITASIWFITNLIVMGVLFSLMQTTDLDVIGKAYLTPNRFNKWGKESGRAGMKFAGLNYFYWVLLLIFGLQFWITTFVAFTFKNLRKENDEE